MPQDNLPRILLSMPSPFAVPGPFFDSAMLIMQDRSLDITPIRPPGTVIHLARHDSLMLMRRGDVPEWDYLCFLDTDQVVSSLVLRRLVRHLQNNAEVGVVAPVIVQREGDPLPVCYKLVGQTPDGNYRYQEQSSAVVAYLSQFREVWLTRSPSPVLPLVPERETDILDLPEDLKAGLADPLYEVDAVGTGMVVIRGSLIQALEPEQPSGLLVSHSGGGEDFNLMRKIKAAGGRIFVDRGCHVGHMTHHSRGVADLCEWKLGLAAQEKVQEEADALLPTVVPDLLNALQPAPPRPWAQIPLPPQPRFREHVLEPVS